MDLGGARNTPSHPAPSPGLSLRLSLAQPGREFLLCPEIFRKQCRSLTTTGILHPPLPPERGPRTSPSLPCPQGAPWALGLLLSPLTHPWDNTNTAQAAPSGPAATPFLPKPLSLPMPHWEGPSLRTSVPRFPVQPQSCVFQSHGGLGSQGGWRGHAEDKGAPKTAFSRSLSGLALCEGFHCRTPVQSIRLPSVTQFPSSLSPPFVQKQILAEMWPLSASGHFCPFLQVGRENPLCALVAPAKSFLQSDLVPLVLRAPCPFPSSTYHHRTLAMTLRFYSMPGSPRAGASRGQGPHLPFAPLHPL